MPRLVALVQAPAGSVGVWLRGERFGIEGQWDYNSDPVGQEWCWTALTGLALNPLPVPYHIEHVDPDSQTALIAQDDQYFLWQPGPEGSYQRIPTEKRRYHGSEIFRPHLVNYKSKRIEVKGAYTMALQGRVLAVASDKAVSLLDPETMELKAKIPVPGVSDLAFEEDHLIMLTFKDRIRVYEINPKVACEHQWDRIWNGAASLTPQEFSTWVYRFEDRNGKRWWDMSDIRPFS